MFAGGRMCSYQDGASMIDLTHSSKSKHGICCNPTNERIDCGLNDRNLVCGPPSNITLTPPENQQILTKGFMSSSDWFNYQHFSFCPKTLVNKIS